MTASSTARRGPCVALFWLAACQCGSGLNGTSSPLPPPRDDGPHYVAPPSPPPIGADASRPLVLYSDLVTAPKGAWITLWGRGFGDAPGSVLFGDVAATEVPSWKDGRIEVRVPDRARSGVVVVRTASAGDSPPMPFAVHQGRILFVAPGSDEGGDGTSASSPFHSLHRAMQALTPGDVLYVRAGHYARVDNYDAVWSFYDAHSGTPERPIAIVGYPGEEAVLGDNRIERCFNFYRGDNARPLENVVIAKLKLRPGCLGIPIVNMNGGRVVGNEVWGSNRECQDGVISLQNASGWKVLGNLVHDNGSMKQDHGIYVAGFGPNRDVEIAWNHVDRQTGGRGIQVYGHVAGDVIERLSIHDNEVTEIDRDGILLGWTDAEPLRIHEVKVWNNVVRHAGRCVGHGIRVDNRFADAVAIFHNTLIENGTGERSCAESPGEPSAQIGIEDAAGVAIRNNLLVSAGRARCLALERRARVVVSHNLFFGPGCSSSPDDEPRSGNPRFVNPATADFRLLPGSPAIDAAALLSEGFLPDHAGVQRPQGPAADVGAYERSGP